MSGSHTPVSRASEEDRRLGFSLSSRAKRFIGFELGETFVRNDTDGVGDFFFFIPPETKQAVALSSLADSLYKHRR